MKRSYKSLLLLLAVLVLAGGVFAVQRMNRPASVTETAEAAPLTDHAAADVAGLAWQTGDTAWHFVRQDGAWQNADDPAFPVNADTLDGMAEAFCALTADRVLENVTDKAAYGLAEPAFTVTAEFSDGASLTCAMGDALPFGDGYYVGLSDAEDKVYTLSDSLETAFAKDSADLARMEELPTVESPSRLVIGSNVDVSYQADSADINPDQHWYLPDGTPADDSQVADLTEAVQAITWQELVYPNADDETLASVGLDEDTALTVTLEGSDGAALSLLLGGADSSSYYARLAGSATVYKVASSALTSLLNASNDALTASGIMALPYESLAAASLTAGGRTVAFTGGPEDEADAADEAAETNDADESAEPAPSPDPVLQSQKDLWALVAALTGEPCQDANDDNGELLLTVTASNQNGVEKTVSFFPSDADHYRAHVENGPDLLVSADAVDRIIRTLRQMP